MRVRPGFITIQLSDKWRVVDDSMQWILQVRTSKPTKKRSGYVDRSYCHQRAALIVCIRRLVKDADSRAMAIIEHFPDSHQ